MIPFSPPRIDDLITNEVVKTLRSGWITTGPRTKEFEKKITAYCGHQTTLCLNSATAGLETILRWYGVKAGDEVILPAYTYSATANVIIHCGAKPVFVDVNADDYNISLQAIEKAITSRTKVVMPVDFGGLPCDYDGIREILVNKSGLFKAETPEQEKLRRILLLSDAAHSFGAEYKGKKTGSLCDVSVFSFHAVKNLTTAEGGAIALNLPVPFDNAAIYAALCISTLHGQNKDALAKTQKGNWRYDIVEAGYKCNMTDLSAAIGLIELARYENDTLLRRREICLRYSELLSVDERLQLPVFETDSLKSSFHLYPLRIKNITEEQRDAVIREIFDHDISVNVHFIPVPCMTFYIGLGYSIKDFPVTYDNYSREISLPVFYDLTEAQIKQIAETVLKAVQKVC
jgi:dTDP-4-amino-4,6-dideoxygalactose transaminase